MIKKVTRFLIPLFFVFLGCKSIPFETTIPFDFNTKDSFYEIDFSRESNMSFYVFRLDLLENEDMSNINGISLNIENKLDSSIKIKVQLENEEAEILSESEVFFIPQKENKKLLFELYDIPYETNATSITFYIEGKLSDGSIYFENLEKMTN